MARISAVQLSENHSSTNLDPTADDYLLRSPDIDERARAVDNGTDHTAAETVEPDSRVVSPQS